jgi:hypothetical protein
MGEMVWADRPDGGQVRFDPDLCVRFPLRARDEDHPKNYLFHKPEGDLWIYVEERIEFRAVGDYHVLLGRSLVPTVQRSCRIVNREEAREMSREAGLDIAESEWAGGGSLPPKHPESGWGIAERESDGQICDALRAIGHRLTTSELLSVMNQSSMNPSESTVKKRLATMVKEGRLTNDPKARPRGYGLPEWTGSFGSDGS